MGTSSVMVGHCQKCHAPIGELTREELDYVVFEARNQLLCFDCDDGSADNTPGFFWEWEDATEFNIGGESFVLNWTANGSPQFSRARAHERTHARGLSSSTYLNRNTIKMGVSGEDREYGECPECKGLGYIDKKKGRYSCLCCNGEGEIVKAVFLPLWLVNGVTSNV